MARSLITLFLIGVYLAPSALVHAQTPLPDDNSPNGALLIDGDLYTNVDCTYGGMCRMCYFTPQYLSTIEILAPQPVHLTVWSDGEIIASNDTVFLGGNGSAWTTYPLNTTVDCVEVGNYNLSFTYANEVRFNSDTAGSIPLTSGSWTMVERGVASFISDTPVGMGVAAMVAITLATIGIRRIVGVFNRER